MPWIFIGHSYCPLTDRFHAIRFGDGVSDPRYLCRWCPFIVLSDRDRLVTFGHQLAWTTVIPSGKRLHNYRKSPFLMGKSTIDGQFSIAMLNYKRVYYTTKFWWMTKKTVHFSYPKSAFWWLKIHQFGWSNFPMSGAWNPVRPKAAPAAALKEAQAKLAEEAVDVCRGWIRGGSDQCLVNGWWMDVKWLLVFMAVEW